MKLIPVFTEKSMSDAKLGKFTFRVNPSLNKDQIKLMVAQSFAVHPMKVTTVNKKINTRRTMYGKIVITKASKKAIVTLKKGEKIAIFEAQEGGKKK